MNIFYKTVLCFVMCSAFVACSDDDGKGVGFSVDKDVITFAAEGGKDVLLVETDGSWTVSVSEPWLTVSPASGTGTMACEVLADSSLANGVRTATVRFSPSVGTSKSVTVNQTGFEKMIVPEKSEIRIESSAKFEERYFETEITTNVKFNVEIDCLGAQQEWLSASAVEVELDRGARPRTVKLRFDWKMNTVPEERVAEVRLVPQGEDTGSMEPVVISVYQNAALRIEDNRSGDSLALVVMYERMNCWSDAWDTGENMQYWSGVTLWEAGDKDLPAEEAVGRVRSVEYFLINTKESVPAEVRHLKYLESLSISSNVNTMLLDIELCTEVCELEYLKHLTLFSYGLVSLPDEFVKLGNTLEVLDLSANNFTEIPPVLTEENFPKLKSLSFVASRRWNTADLRRKDEYDSGIGLHINASTDDAFRRLLLWENLEELSLSNCYIEGELPDFKVGEDGVEAYTQADVDAWGGDTIQYVADNAIPKILPSCRMLRINLNFFTGNLPDWLLYHPRLLEWAPELLVFNQQEQGLNSAGEHVRFDNEPKTFDYYYDVFPGMRDKFEFKEEITEE